MLKSLSPIQGSAIVAVFGALLLLPQLSSFGLWEPAEVAIADAVRAASDPSQASPPLKRPRADQAKTGAYGSVYIKLVSAGLATLGVSELGARLPLALCGLLTLALVYYVVIRLVGLYAALAAAAVLPHHTKLFV